MAINLDDVTPHVVTADPANKIWLFYGETGTRKTSVSCRFPNHLLLAYDMGFNFINGAMPVPMQDWASFKDVVRQLELPKNKNRFDVIIIDTVGQAYQSCYQFMCRQMGVSSPGEAGKYGIGWKKIRNEFETTIRSIAQKGYGVILLAHSDENETVDDATKQVVVQTKIDIDKRPNMIAQQMSDFVFYLRKEARDGTTDEPTVYAYTNLLNIDTKCRPRDFVPRFEFTYENLCHELEVAVAKQYAREGLEMPDSMASKNYFEIEQVNFETLRNDVRDLAIALNEQHEHEVSELLLNMFKGVSLSELTASPDTIASLQVALATFKEWKAKYNV